MKRMKLGIVALVIAMLAITAVAVAAQPPNGNGDGGRGRGQGFGAEFQVIADALGIDLTTLQTDLQAGKTIADIATEQKVELSTVVDAVVANRQEVLATAVTDGRLTQAQADAQITLLKANLDVQFTKSFERPGIMGDRPGFGGQRGGAQIQVIADALGVDVATLQSDLQSGKTIADIATEQKVELSAVVDAVVTSHEALLTQAVTDGKLTQAQADAQLERLKTDLTTRFSEPWDANRGGMGFGGNRPDGQGNGGNRPGGQGNGGNRPGGQGNGGNRPGGNRPGGQGNNAPAAPEMTPEATVTANA